MSAQALTKKLSKPTTPDTVELMHRTKLTSPAMKSETLLSPLGGSSYNSPQKRDSLMTPSNYISLNFQQLSDKPGTVRATQRATMRQKNTLKWHTKQKSVVRLNSVVEIDEQCVVEVFCFARMIVNHPYAMCLFAWSIVSCALYITYKTFTLDGFGNYSPRDYADVRYATAYGLVKSQSWDDYPVETRTTQSAARNIYVWARAKDGGNILTPSRIQELYNLELTIINRTNYSRYCMLYAGNCFPPFSILSDLKDLNQSEIEAYTLDLVNTNDINNLLTLSKDVSADHLESNVYRSMHYIGSPLDGFTNSKDRGGTQTEIFLEWGMDYYFDFRDDLASSVTEAYVYSASYIMFQDLIFIALDRTNIYVLMSVCFVYLLLGAYIRSWYLGIVGILCIVMTFGPAYALFTNVFQITHFDPLMIAIVYVILGIGADDIFVFTDAWRQAPFLALGGKENIDIRMSYAFSRATKAMALTQVTTMIAFACTAMSDIIPIKAFGFWSATCIGVAYMMVITIFPLALVIELRHKWIDCGAGRCFSWCNSQVEERDLNSGDVSKVGEPNRVERFFATIFLDFLNKVRFICLVLAVVVGSVGIYCVTLLSPPTETAQWLTTAEYEGQTLSLFGSTEFASSQDLGSVEPVLVWGIKWEDRSGVNMWDEGSGVLIMDDEFNPSPEVNQQFLLDVCNITLPTLAHDLYITSIDELLCPMLDFKEWLEAQGEEFPVRENTFSILFASFLRDGTYGITTAQKTLAGFINETVSYISIIVPVDLYELASGTQKKPIYDAWEKMKNDLNAEAPDGVNKAVHTCSGNEWQLMRTEEALVVGAAEGIAVALPTAFLAIFSFTRNLIVSVFAILTIIQIILTICIIIVSMGWEFGVVETISLVIIIGFSVDYVVHLGHSYWEARHNKKDRLGRSKIALMTMGATVSMGAITTFFGGLPLIFTEIVLFVRMGTLMIATVCLAWFWAMFLFMPLLIVFGPQGNVEWISKKNKTLRQMLHSEMLEYAQMDPNDLAEASKSSLLPDEDQVSQKNLFT